VGHLADPSELCAIADRISCHLDAVRSGATALGTAATNDRWRGIASDLFADGARACCTLAEVIRGLALRGTGEADEIDVRIMTGADGARRVIVDLPHEDIRSDPAHRGHRALDESPRFPGRPDLNKQGVLQAMRAVGVRPADEVMLVGTATAPWSRCRPRSAARAAGSFRVSHVVTTVAPPA
jgi:hypothetical protein